MTPAQTEPRTAIEAGSHVVDAAEGGGAGVVGATAAGPRPVAPGDVLRSPAQDLRADILDVTPELLRAEVHAGPRGNGGPLHRHLRQEERFLVHEGALRVRVGFRGSRVVGAGDELAIPAGAPHTFQAVGDGARFTAEFRPAFEVAAVFRDVFALSAEGRLDENGNPRLRDLALLLERYPEDFFYLAYAPVRLQRAIGALVRRLGPGRE